jgi:ribosomal protein S18 acetylase RimI-like enzyme
MSSDRIFFFVLGSAFALAAREIVVRLRGGDHPKGQMKEDAPVKEDIAAIASQPAAPQKKIAVLPVTTEVEIKATRELFVEYGQSLGFSLCFQSFDQEYASLPGKYAPPRGRLLLAEVDGQAAGCVALRPLETGVCEMKRLYVRPAFRGLGLGRRLAETVIAEAKLIGYQAMRLDTVEDKMQSAVALYRALGFHQISPYTVNPEASVLFMQLDLVPTPQLSLYGDAE